MSTRTFCRGGFSSVFGVRVELSGNIYLYEPSSGGILKASLHRDGRSHIAVDSNFHKHQGLPNQARFFQKWHVPDGYSLPAFRILIPWSELRFGDSPFASGSNTLVLASGPPGHVVEVTLHFMRSHGELPVATHYESGSGPLRFLMTATMLHNRSAIMLVRTYEPSPPTTAFVEAIRRIVLEGDRMKERRTVVYTCFSDGVRGCIDLALD